MNKHGQIPKDSSKTTTPEPDCGDDLNANKKSGLNSRKKNRSKVMSSCFDKCEDEEVADWIKEKFIKPTHDQKLEMELERLDRD